MEEYQLDLQKNTQILLSYLRFYVRMLLGHFQHMSAFDGELNDGL